MLPERWRQPHYCSSAEVPLSRPLVTVIVRRAARSVWPGPRRNVASSVEQLAADVRTRLLARIEAAQAAGRISPERAAKLRERVTEASLCGPRKHVRAPFAAGGMVRAAAAFLGLGRAELRAQLPGNSLAGLAEKQGKSVAALKAAMVEPAKQRLTKAVASGKLTQARADRALAKLERLADRFANKVFASR